MISLPKALVPPFLWLLGLLTSFYVLPVPDVLQTGAAVTCLALAAAAHFIISRKDISRKEITFSPVSMLVLALWGLAVVSMIASDVKFIALTYIYFFGAFPLSFLIFSSCDTRAVLMAVRGVIVVVGISALVQFFAMPEMLKFGGTHFPFADNNTLGALLATGALLCFGKSLRSGKYSPYYLAASIILFAAILTTEGRAIALVFGGAFAVLCLSVCPRQKKPVWIFLLSALVLLCSMKQSDLSVWHWFGEGEKTIESFATTGMDTPNALSGSRFMIWDSAARIFAEHPVTGTGIGTFFMYYPEFRHPRDDSAGYMAHNDLIQFATEMGFLAPLIVLGIVGCVLFITWRRVKGAEEADRLDILIPFSVFLLICGHSLVNFNFYILPLLMVSGLNLAVWNNRTASKKVMIGQNKMTREVIAVFGTCLFLIPLWGVSLSEFKVGQAISRLKEKDVAGFAESLNMADTLGFGINGRAYLQAAIFAGVTKDDKRAMMFLDKTEQVNPRIVPLYLERSRLLLPTDKAAALAQAETALRLDTSSIPARMQIADILESMGQRTEAYAVLKQGMVGYMRFARPKAYYERVAKMAAEFKDTDIQDMAQKRLRGL